MRNHSENLRLLSEDVWTAIKSLEQIVGDILDFGRSQNARLKCSIQRVNLCQLGLAMRDEVSTLLRTKRQDLSVTLPDAPMWTRADPLRMNQVLRNLIDNAAKFSPPGSKICLRITALDHSIQIEVEDSAEPIDSQDERHLFTAYYRGAKAQERRVPGLGLGLFISKQLVELQGGKIWLAKNEQRGNRFCILLPKE
jgi:signal transduction histidine kinase